MLRTKRNVYFQTKVISIKQDLKCRNEPVNKVGNDDETEK